MSFSPIFGWVQDEEAVEDVMKTLPFPIFGDIHSSIKGSGKGKVVLLHQIVEKVAGAYPMRVQTIGDCVSMGAAYAVDIAKCVDIWLRKEFEEWIAETATEDIYAGSRVIIGKGSIRNGDGSIGAWAAEYLTKYGAIARGKYGNIDLSVYDGKRARQWGRSGVGAPKEIVELNRQHPIEIMSLVRTYEEVRDLIANGYSITIASNQGFSNKRDKQGFAKPQGTWPHQMHICAVDDESGRPGVLIPNSWPKNWISGPKRHGQPEGSFWCDADVLEQRILREGDSWAFSGYQGFKPRKLDTRII